MTFSFFLVLRAAILVLFPSTLISFLSLSPRPLPPLPAANQQHLAAQLTSINMHPTQGLARDPHADYADVTVPGGMPYTGSSIDPAEMAHHGQYHTGPDVNKYLDNGISKGGGIVPSRRFDEDHDAKRLRKAMKGLGVSREREHVHRRCCVSFFIRSLLRRKAHTVSCYPLNDGRV